jgi:hypothetical protein
LRAGSRVKLRHAVLPRKALPRGLADENDVAMDGGPVKTWGSVAGDQPTLPIEEMNLCQYSGPLHDQ